MLDWVRIQGNIWKYSGQGKERYYYTTDTASLAIWFSEGDVAGIDMSAPVSAGSAWEIECANSVMHAIGKKERKRNPPNIQPCILVVYPNMRRGDESVVSDIIIHSLESAGIKYYDEIWMISELSVNRLY